MSQPREPSSAARITARVLPVYGVVAIWLAASSATLAWLELDHTPPSWDPAVHLSWSLVYHAYLSELPPADALAGVATTSDYYPPLVHLGGALVWKLFGVIPPADTPFDTADLPVLVNLLYLLVLMCSVYALANRCYGALAALCAAFIVAVYPILSGQTRSYLLDFPLTALTAWLVCLVAASRGLTHRWLGWPIGCILGLGLLAKWSVAVFAAPAVIAALFEGRRRVRAGEARPAAIVYSLLAIGVVALVVAGPWYLSHPGAIVRELLTSNQTWQTDADPGPLSLAGIGYYPAALLRWQLFLPFNLLAVLGALIAWRRRRELAGFGLLAAWFAGGLVLLWLVPNKDPRFSMPLLPALAVLSCSWLAPVTSPGRRRAAAQAAGVTLLLGYGSLQFHAVAFGLPFVHGRVGPAAAPWLAEAAHFTGHPSRLDWPHEALARDIVALTPPGGLCAVMPNTAHVNFLTVRYYVARQSVPVLLRPERRVVVRGGVAAEAKPLADWLAESYDTVLMLDGNQGAHAGPIEAQLALLRAEWWRFRAVYRPAAEYTLPGGERLVLYQRARP